jgi:hypothetical protein
MDAKEKSNENRRKIIQFKVVPCGNEGAIVALCNDGTLWTRFTRQNSPWLLFSEVPQPDWDEEEFEYPV